MTAIPNDRKIRKEQIIGVVKEIQAGTNITLDDADPERPIISASGGGGVESVTGDGVDNTDPSNPVIDTLAWLKTLDGFNSSKSQYLINESNSLEWVDRYSPITTRTVSIVDLGGGATYSQASISCGIQLQPNGLRRFTIVALNIITTGIPTGEIAIDIGESIPITQYQTGQLIYMTGTGISGLADYDVRYGPIGYITIKNKFTDDFLEDVTFTIGKLKLYMDL